MPKQNPEQVIRVGNMTNSTIVGGDHKGDIIHTSSSPNRNTMDFVKLTEELTQLRKAMKEVNVEDDHDISIGEVRKAEQASQNQDLPSVLAHLKAAGIWALEIATKIGVSVAADAIKQAIGLKS